MDVLKTIGLNSAMLPSPGSALAPRYWRDETSGHLARAIRSYLDNPDAMTLQEIGYLRAYLRQWVESPAWDANPADDAESRAELALLRGSIDGIRDGRGISRWLHAALDAGIDPL